MSDLAEVAGFEAHLGFELGGEVVGAFEVETVGNLLDAEFGGGEELFGTEEAELLLVGGWGESGVLLEELAEVAITDTEFGGDLLDGEGGLERLADAESGPVDHVYVLLVATEFDVAFEGVHHTDEVVDDTGHELLGVGGFLKGSVVGPLVEGLDGGRVADVVDGLLWRQETGTDAVVDVAAAEAYPIAFPSDGGLGVIGVPLTGEEEEHVAGTDGDRGTVNALEKAFAFRIVEELVFVEGSAPADVEVVAVGMTFGGVGLAGQDMFVAYGADSEAP